MLNKNVDASMLTESIASSHGAHHRLSRDKTSKTWA